MQTKANERDPATRLRAALFTAGSLLALAVPLSWRPSTAVTAPADPTALVVLVAGWLAWGLTLYLAVGTAVTAAGHLSRAARPLARLAPSGLRRCVEVAVGATAAAVCLAPAAAYAGPPSPPPGVTASPLDWPGLSPAPTAPVRTAAPAAPSAPAAPTAAADDERTLVVRPGDSLWSLTARELGPHATPARVAATWPRLYAANRRVIGPDANLIHPGQRLVRPTPQERTSR